MLKVTWPPAAGGSGTNMTFSGMNGTLSTSQAVQVKAWPPKQQQLSTKTTTAQELCMVPAAAAAVCAHRRLFGLGKTAQLSHVTISVGVFVCVWERES
jgi:hypothetical protein